MGCTRCNNKAEEVEGFNVCKSCLSSMVEKQVKKSLRKMGQIKKGDTLFLVDDGTSKGACLRALFPEVLESLPVQIRETKKGLTDLPPGLDGEKVLLPWTMEDEGDSLLQYFMARDDSWLMNSDESVFVKPLVGLSNKEARAYASIKGQSWENEVSNSSVSHFLDHMEEMHPETKRSLVRTSEQLKKLCPRTHD